MTFPAKEGVSEHIFSLLKLLSETGQLRPVLLMCDRGTISDEQFHEFPWPTILVPDSTYYDYGEIRVVLDDIAPDILHSYGIFQARTISSRYSVENKIPLIMDHQDIDVELATNYDKSLRLKNHQLEVMELASLNRFLSSRDESILSRILPEREHTARNIPSFVADLRIKMSLHARNPQQILFIGSGSYPPNKNAMDFIANELAPSMPNINFHLVGRLTDEYTGANVTGYGMVDDIASIASRAAIGIAPLEFGSGLKIKVMTCLSAGLPVVGTKVAFQGYKENGSLIESTLSNFREVLSSTIRIYDSKLERLAYEHFLANYSLEANRQKTIDMYRGLKYDAHVTADNSSVVKFDINKLSWLKNDFNGRSMSSNSHIRRINWF